MSEMCSPVARSILSPSVSLQLQVGGTSSAKRSPKCAVHVNYWSHYWCWGDEKTWKTEQTVCLCVTLKEALGMNLKSRWWNGVLSSGLQTWYLSVRYSKVKKIYFMLLFPFDSVCCERCSGGSRSVLEQVHISQSNKTGLSLPTWIDGCTFSPCVGVGEGGRWKHTQSPLCNDPQSLCWRKLLGETMEEMVHVDSSKCTKKIQTGNSLSNLGNESQLPTWSQSGHVAQTWRRCSDGKISSTGSPFSRALVVIWV